MADPARWTDGEPANLRAAAADALPWLDALQEQAAYVRMPAQDQRRLMACRAALARHVGRIAAPEVPHG